LTELGELDSVGKSYRAIYKYLLQLASIFQIQSLILET